MVSGITSQKKIDACFAMLEQCAAEGKRCPVNGDGINGGILLALALEGKIKVNVYAKNFRMVEILVGPQAGKTTEKAPEQYGKPYRVADENGYHMIGDARRRHMQRQAPSPPQLLKRSA